VNPKAMNLIASSAGEQRHSWRRLLAAAPGVGASLLPKLACPACWPAYAGLLSALGLGFLIPSTHLLALTAVFLVIAVGALAWSTWRAHTNLAPLALGVAGAGAILWGKFWMDSEPLLYVGVGLLVAGSLWVSLQRSHRGATPGCPNCP